MHWDWEWHYGDSHCYRPWQLYSYHYKCPVRKRFAPAIAADIDWDYDYHHYDCGYTVPEWCHHTCLTGRVYVETGEEEDTCGKGTFKVVLDVHHFKAEELKLKVKNNDILIVEGKHADERAAKSPALCIAKEFTRKYKLPRNYDATLAKATLSKDGILSIMVAAPPPLDDAEREIVIQPTETYFGSVADSKGKAIAGNDEEEAAAIAGNPDGSSTAIEGNK